MMRWLRRSLRHVARVALGTAEASPIRQLMEQDGRWPTFRNAVDYVNFEGIPGVIAECGVFSGVSLALLAQAQQWHDHEVRRTIVGFDSFDGLPPSSDEHQRWTRGSFAVNPWPHPVIPPGARVTPDKIRELFRVCGLQAPDLEVGMFAKTLSASVPSKYDRIALLHVDCDLYESTVDVFAGAHAAFQDGTIVLFDDWFLYKGNPHRGEARAFTEFLQAQTQWQAVPYRDYGTCGKAFILSLMNGGTAR